MLWTVGCTGWMEATDAVHIGLKLAVADRIDWMADCCVGHMRLLNRLEAVEVAHKRRTVGCSADFGTIGLQTYWGCCPDLAADVQIVGSKQN